MLQLNGHSTLGMHGQTFISIICQHACMTMGSESSGHLSACSNGPEPIARIPAVRGMLPRLRPITDVCLFAGFSWLFRPVANWFLRSAERNLTNPNMLGLILCSRAALTMWEGVQETKWSFLSPPWQLRDKGNLIFNCCVLHGTNVIP